MNIDPTWTDSGKRSATECGLSFADVVEMLDSPTAIHLVNSSWDSIWFIDHIRTGVFTVILDRQTRNITIYGITRVRPAGRDEIRMWESKQS